MISRALSVFISTRMEFIVLISVKMLYLVLIIAAGRLKGCGTVQIAEVVCHGGIWRGTDSLLISSEFFSQEC